MGKTKVTQADSPNPALKHDAFLSKNKKRKEKRYSHELMAKKVETSEFIPVKRSSLRPSQVTGLRKRANTQLSTSLPIKGIGKKQLENANHSFALCSQNDKMPKKVTGILSNPNTPKRHRSGKEHVTFELANDIEKENSSNKRITRSHQMDEKKQSRIESSDESDVDSDDPVNFLDLEADEGEESTSSDSSSSTYSDTDDRKNVGDENTYVSSFLYDEESESGDEDEDDDNDDEDQDSEGEEEESSGENNVAVEANTKNVNRRKLKTEVTIPVKLTKKSGPLQTSPETTLTALVKKEKSTEQKNSVKTNLRSPAKVVKSTNSEIELKYEQKERSQTAKSRVGQEELEKKKKPKPEGTEEVLKREKFEKPSEFIGFIRKLPAVVTQEEIKLALARIVAANDVLAVMLVKPRRNSGHNAFIYLKDSKSLGNLIHQKVDIGDSSYVVYRAKSSAREESSPEPVGFLPRVPQWVTEAELKQVVEKYVGSGKVKEIREKKVLKTLQTRNILIYFTDSDALKKAIYQAEFKIKDHVVIIREAAEGVPVSVYRAVFANIPDKTNEATLKKAVEASIGKNTVANVRFSFHKNAYAFVVFNDEAAMKKALVLGDGLSVNGKKVQVRPYVPRKPHKRAPSNEHAKVKIAKKRKSELASVIDDEPEQSKKPKVDLTPGVPSTLSLQSPNGSQFKNKKNSNKRKKSTIASPTGQVKATKNLTTNKQKKGKKSSFVGSPDKERQIIPPKDKIRVKKSKSKGKKLPKKKND